jgi:hypothetical protein
MAAVGNAIKRIEQWLSEWYDLDMERYRSEGESSDAGNNESRQSPLNLVVGFGTLHHRSSMPLILKRYHRSEAVDHPS